MPEVTITVDDSGVIQNAESLAQYKLPSKINGQAGTTDVGTLLKIEQLEQSARQKHADLAEERKNLERDLELSSMLRRSKSENSPEAFKEALRLAGFSPEEVGQAFGEGQPGTGVPASGNAQDDEDDPLTGVGFDMDKAVQEGVVKTLKALGIDPRDLQGTVARAKAAAKVERKTELERRIDKVLDSTPDFRVLLSKVGNEGEKDLRSLAYEAVGRRAATATVVTDRLFTDGVADALARAKRLGIGQGAEGDQGASDDLPYAGIPSPGSHYPKTVSVSGGDVKRPKEGILSEDFEDYIGSRLFQLSREKD